MFTSWLRRLGIGRRNEELANYEPIYGLTWRSLDEWLSRNPKLKEEHAALLAERALTRRPND